MRRQITTVALAAATLLLSASMAHAIDSKVAVPLDSKASATSPGKQQAGKLKPSASAAVKPIDINKASVKELTTLTGIGETEAAKIVAGRPYGSKADLVTHNIIDAGVYGGIKSSIIAKQPYKDGKKNAALYTDKK